MVLAATVKRIISIALGAALFYGVGYLFIAMFARWYEPRYIKSDDEIGVAFVASLAVLFALTTLGAFVGNKLYRSLVHFRARNRRKSGK